MSVPEIQEILKAIEAIPDRPTNHVATRLAPAGGAGSWCLRCGMPLVGHGVAVACDGVEVDESDAEMVAAFLKRSGVSQ